MPTQGAKYCREKAVLITVYEEKPQRRSVSQSQRHHHHHHHHYHHHHYLHPINNQCKNGDSDKGYNRRAELLRYSHSLRDSARSPAASTSFLRDYARSPAGSTSLLPKPIPPNKNQQPQTKTVTVQRKQSIAETPACLGNWTMLIPSFIKCLTSPEGKKDRKKNKQSRSTTNKMKALMKSLQNRGFIPKLLSTLGKHR